MLVPLSIFISTTQIHPTDEDCDKNFSNIKNDKKYVIYFGYKKGDKFNENFIYISLLAENFLEFKFSFSFWKRKSNSNIIKEKMRNTKNEISSFKNSYIDSRKESVDLFNDKETKEFLKKYLGNQNEDNSFKKNAKILNNMKTKQSYQNYIQKRKSLNQEWNIRREHALNKQQASFISAIKKNTLIIKKWDLRRKKANLNRIHLFIKYILII